MRFRHRTKLLPILFTNRGLQRIRPREIMLLPIQLRASLWSSSLRRHTRSFHRSGLGLRIFDSVRSEDGLYDLLLLSTSRSLPLITLWSASWCPSCHTIRPLIQRLAEEQAERGLLLGFAEVEIDLPGTSSLASLYSVSSIPTILAFHRGSVLDNRIVDVRRAKDGEYLRRWLRECAASQ